MIREDMLSLLCDAVNTGSVGDLKVQLPLIQIFKDVESGW